VASPPVFLAFDLLYCDRRDLTARPLGDRRARLEDVVANDLVFPVRRLAADGLEAWKQVIEHGYEGYVAKDKRVRERADEAMVESEARRSTN
jgi:ATP-dependent DNA ligase